MSIYSCYLVTLAAMRELGDSNIPVAWFNWIYEFTPPDVSQSAALRRLEIVESSESPRVQAWYTQVTQAGLASTLIDTSAEPPVNFPFTATDPWGGGAKLFVGTIIPGDKDEIAGWINHLSQPDELAVLEWLDHQVGGGGDCNRYFNRVENFAHCYANELKRWIACDGNAELLADQWDDVRGWPEDTPSLTVDDFAWDRGAPFGNLWTVPMRRLPFCEIGFDKLASCSSTNGLLPDDRQEGRWLFDLEGKVEAELKRRAHAESMMRNAAPVAAGRDEAAGGVPLRDWCPRPNAQPAFLQDSMASRVNRSHVALMGAEPDVDANAGFTIDLGTYFRDATLFPDTAAEVDAGWDDAKLTIQWHLPARTSVAFKAIRLPQGWDLQITLAPTDTPLLLTAGNGYWVEFPVANDTRLHELKGTISARRLPAPD